MAITYRAAQPVGPIPGQVPATGGTGLLAAGTFDRAGNAMTQASGGPTVTNPTLPGPAVIDPAFMRAMQALVKARQVKAPVRDPFVDAMRSYPPDSNRGGRTGDNRGYGDGPSQSGGSEPMVPLFRELIAMPGGGTGYGPLTTRQTGSNSMPAGSVPASQAAYYAGPQNSGQQGDFGQTEKMRQNAVHDAWSAANPGEGPFSGSFSFQEAQRRADAEAAAKRAKT